MQCVPWTLLALFINLATNLSVNQLINQSLKGQLNHSAIIIQFNILSKSLATIRVSQIYLSISLRVSPSVAQLHRLSLELSTDDPSFTCFSQLWRYPSVQFLACIPLDQ